MFKRYDLNVYYSDVPLYSASFSSINNLVKFACGFNDTICDIDAVDTLYERSIPIEELILEFRSDFNGI